MSFKKGNRIRLSFGNTKTIWLYTGYTWEELVKGSMEDGLKYGECTKRAEILIECNVLIDGRYIDSQRDTTLKWRGSFNQRVIDIQQSLQKGEIVLWQP